jgi:exodeoxyribonuclease VII small subunit
MNTQQRTYQETYAELQLVLTKLERDSSSIDELSDNLNRGFDLLEELKAKLTAAEARVEAVIAARTQSKNNIETDPNSTEHSNSSNDNS